mmetsp:Transcript_66705/g.217120  ORF Transcript_66705/g.217120 Transcript_66705/m.217120 type:complete len:229 (+) Transcript_66705:28-714(+)
MPSHSSRPEGTVAATTAAPPPSDRAPPRPWLARSPPLRPASHGARGAGGAGIGSGGGGGAAGGAGAELQRGRPGRGGEGSEERDAPRRVLPGGRAGRRHPGSGEQLSGRGAVPGQLRDRRERAAAAEAVGAGPGGQRFRPPPRALGGARGARPAHVDATTEAAAGRGGGVVEGNLLEMRRELRRPHQQAGAAEGLRRLPRHRHLLRGRRGAGRGQLRGGLPEHCGPGQ